MKQKRFKCFAAAAGAGLLAAAVAVCSVMSRKIEAEAAETFLGIEKLRTQVAESKRTYTILEIVPDRSVAQIGFLFDGFEPLLSTWNEEKMQWESWKETLCSLPSAEARTDYIEEMKEKLQAYYDQNGFGKNVPVTISKDVYEESDTKKDGFQAVTASAEERIGWFEIGSGTGENYRLVFSYQGDKNEYDEESGYLYYKIKGTPADIAATDVNLEAMAADTVIYEKMEEGVFVYAGTWEELSQKGFEQLTEPATEGETETEDETATESETGTEQETDTETGTEQETTTEPQSEDETTTETENDSDKETENGEEPTSEDKPEKESEPESESKPEKESESESESKSEKGSEPESESSPAEGSDGGQVRNERMQTGRFFVLSAKNPTTEEKTEESGAGGTEESSEAGSSGESGTEKSSETESNGESGTGESDTEEASDAGDGEKDAAEEGDTEESSAEDAAKLINDGANVSGDIPGGRYYTVSFERITEPETLLESDTIYIVQDIIRSPNGEYIFIDSDDENEKRQTYTFGGVTIYCKNTFKNNEWFKKYALDMEEQEYKQFPVQVLSLTPKELNEMEELPKFDFLYLNSGERITGTGGTNGQEQPTADYTAEGMDFTSDSAKRLFERVTAGGLPCLVDGRILYETNEEGTSVVREAYKEKQIFRLAEMLCQPDLESWYEAHTQNMMSVKTEELLEAITDADKNFATGQTYCRLKENSIVNADFAAATIYSGNGNEVEEGFQNVLDEIELENLYRQADNADSGESRPLLSTDISQARVLRHIMNYQNRRNIETKKNIKVLEIQPALTTQAELTLEQLQKWAPGVESVDTTIMTTAEFIGKIEKLNELYDLIYIGTSKEHLNISNWVTDSGTDANGKYQGSTVFNDTDMDGLIYYNIGDLRVVNLPMGGLLDTEYWNGDRNDWTYYYNYVRYGGNDITEEKRDALYSFLNGSYPVIVSDEFIEQPATVFEEKEYAGRRATLKAGTYTAEQLREQQIYAGDAGTDNAKRISGVKVKEGYRLTLYAAADLTGESLEITRNAGGYSVVRFDSAHNPIGDAVQKQSVADLSGFKTADGAATWDNRCNSIKIEKLEGVSSSRAVDGDHIDNCTYLYEFVDTVLKKDYTNFYVKEEIDETGSELFKFYLNRPKASLTDFTANGVKGGASGSTAVNDAYYIRPNANGIYTLRYSFKIQNEGAASAGTQYVCRLYIDVNADGKFSDYEEISDISLTQNGAAVTSDALYAGKEYVLTRQVPPGYKGLLPWKVEVCQKDNSNIYASQTGYTKLEGLEQETLRICQINKNGSDVINLNYEVNTEGRIFHTLVYGGDYGNEHYDGITDDFILDITTIDINTFEENIRNNPDYLDTFNMLILGFSDMYGDFSGDAESGAMGAIVEFIKSGKSVLLGHDTTSFFNNPTTNPNYGLQGQADQYGYPWRNNHSDKRGMMWYDRNAATLNRYIRPLVAMDRYGIMDSAILRKGAALKEGSGDWNEVVNSGRDVAYKPKSGKKETVPEVHGYTYTTISAKDLKVNEDAGITLRSFTKWELYSGEALDALPDNWSFVNEYRNIRYDYVQDGSARGYYGEVVSPNNGEVNDLKVTQVNKGQITEYPYKLQESFVVAQTHAQYYELDYTADDDQDGESDLVVWYCLGGRNSGKTPETIYSQSPNDVRNNYYIYNKGNITYTGMGHARTCTLEEAKLFINTMIASYQAGVKQPYISVKENKYPESAQLRAVYRYTDKANEIALDDEATAEVDEKFYFTAQDVNFVKGTRRIASHVYYEAADGTEEISVGGVKIKVNRLEDRIFNANTDEPVDAGNLESGGMYYALVPKSVLKRCESGPFTLYFEAQSTITTNTAIVNTYVTDKVYAEVEVMQAYLFDLD